MAYECRIDAERQIGFVTLTGSIDGPQIREAMTALFGHPEWKAGYASLWDAQAVESLAILPDDLSAISGTMAAARIRAGAGRGAWVVQGNLAKSIGVLLAHRAQQQGNERRCFTDYEEARRWLLEDPLRQPGEEVARSPRHQQNSSAQHGR